MIFIVFSKGSLGIITHKYLLYRAYIGISHRGTLGPGYSQLSPDTVSVKELLGLGSVVFAPPPLQLNSKKKAINQRTKRNLVFTQRRQLTSILGGGFKHFLFSPLFGEDVPLD